MRVYGGQSPSPQIAMRRHPALIPFSHHHHRALVVARRTRAAAGDAEALLAAGRDFLIFFDGSGVTHSRDEEEHLFPLLFEQAGAEAPEEPGLMAVDFELDAEAFVGKIEVFLSERFARRHAMREPQ